MAQIRLANLVTTPSSITALVLSIIVFSVVVILEFSQ